MGTPARSPAQETRERALNKVFDTLEELELLTTRIRRSQAEVARMPACEDLAARMGNAAEQVEAARKELQRGAYFNVGQPDKLF